MEETKTEENERQEKLRDEMAKILRNSMLTGVPHVIEEKRVVRKLIKIAILAACLAGFSIQISQFLQHFYSNPTIVEHSMQKVQTFHYPSIVMCNKNPIYRSSFCEKFPNNCTAFNKNVLCSWYRHYCVGDLSNFRIPRKPTEWMTMNATDLKDMGYNLSTFLGRTTRRHEVSNHTYYYKTVVGQVYFCYRKYFRGDNNKELYVDEPGESHYVIWNSYFFDEYDFNLEASETFHQTIIPGALFDIQSPFETQFKGISLEHGKGYHIYIDLEEEHLLPPPFATNCRNYTDEWIQNNKTGPRSQKICQQDCHMELSREVCGCVHEFFFFGNLYKMEDICTGEEEKDCSTRIQNGTKQTLLHYVNKLSMCKNACRDDCLIRRFHFQVQEYDNGLIGKGLYRTSVYLSLKNMEVKVISHKPKFEDVEIFSNVGGYLGLWLGFCIVAGVDFLQSVLVVLLYAVHKCCNRAMKTNRFPSLRDRSFWRKKS